LSDADGNAIAGATVQWLTPAGGAGATLSSTSVVTDSSGNATVTATANSVAGGFFVAATFDALQATFSLTNVPAAASVIAATGGTPQSAIVGQPFAAPLAVHVTDAFGNAAVGTVVTFTPPASGASAVLSSNVATVDANGNASVTATANAIEGSYTVTAGI